MIQSSGSTTLPSNVSLSIICYLLAKYMNKLILIYYTYWLCFNCSLEEMYIQPSLSKDSLFVALKMSFARFPVFNRLCLGYTEPFQESGMEFMVYENLIFENFSSYCLALLIRNPLCMIVS